LIGLGFAESRDDVQEMIDLVDEDGSGKIEFGEFLSIIKNSDGNEVSIINYLHNSLISLIENCKD
jgi:hypothetical protein